MQLTLQAFNDGHWQDAFVITIATPEAAKNSRVSLQALTTYAAAYFDEAGSRSFSAMYPVNPMDVYSFNSWPGVFEDIMPMGYARTIWLNMLGLQQQPVATQDIALLRAGTIAPVGNLRLKESVEMVIAALLLGATASAIGHTGSRCLRTYQRATTNARTRPP